MNMYLARPNMSARKAFPHSPQTQTLKEYEVTKRPAAGPSDGLKIANN